MAEDADRLARKYSRGLLIAFAEAEGVDGTSALEKELVESASLGSGEVGAFFDSPIFNREEKLGVLTVLAEGGKIPPRIGKFLSLLISLRHASLLPKIATAYSEALREQRKEVRAYVRTAFALDSKESEKLAAALSKATGKKVGLEVTLDKELIGGVVARVGSVVYDSSVRSYLNRLKEEFTSWR